MAFSSALALVAGLLSIAFTSSSAQGLFNNVTLSGVITCPYTSLARAGTFPVIPQAKVDVVCGIPFLERVTRSTTADKAGTFSIGFTPLEVLFSNQDLCHLNVTIPSDSKCTFDPPGGSLRFPIITIRSSAGVVIDYVPGAPTYVLPRK